MTINLPIISDYDYFGELIKLIIQQKELHIFIEFVNKHDIIFKLYKVEYNINVLYKNYESIITTTLINEPSRNNILDLFQNEKIQIIRLYEKVLTSCPFELARFFSSILMSANARSKEDDKEIQKIKNNIFNNKIVAAWMKQNQNILHNQIINKCHE